MNKFVKFIIPVMNQKIVKYPLVEKWLLSSHTEMMVPTVSKQFNCLILAIDTVSIIEHGKGRFNDFYSQGLRDIDRVSFRDTR